MSAFFGNLFGKLRTRLITSYILILVITLIVICGLLMFVLRANPQTVMVNLSLVNKLQQFDAQQDQLNVQYTSPLLLKQMLLLNRTADRYGMRILLVDSHMTVAYDSRSSLKTGTKLTTQPEPYMLDWGSNLALYPMVRGVFLDEKGASWLYVGQAPDPDHANNPNVLQVWFAHEMAAPLTVQQLFQYYGQDIFIPLLESGGVGLVIAIIVSLILARSVARPLQEVAKAADAFAQGDATSRAPLRGPHEVRTVAETFNRMADEVSATQQTQRDFLANVTHDLKTPLTSIQGFSQAIIDGVVANPSAAGRAAQIIYDEAGRMNRMVQELLDLARIEAGRFAMTRHSIMISEIVRAVGERLQFRAKDKGVILVVDVPELPNIAGDGDRLAQVFTNLVDNAIKHTDQGTVTLSAGLSGGGILIQVSDTGEGIPTPDLPHIFERFYQVDKSRQSQRREGAGLGLTITKQIVDAHGGRIWAESIEGQGTKFSTWFPLPGSDMTTLVRRRSARMKFSREEVSAPAGGMK
jgi:signal transduction histidine kinase